MSRLRPSSSLFVLGSLLLACRPTTSTVEPGPTLEPTAQGPIAADVPRVSDDPVIQKVVELGRSDSRVQAHLDHLTHAIGPRLTSSHALMDAEKWCRDQFDAFGLEARLERWGEFPVGFDRGPWSGRVVGAQGDLARLEMTTPSWTPGSFGPVVGRALPYPETMADLHRIEGQLEGAWVLRPAWRDAEGPPKKLREKLDKALAKAKIAGQVVRAGGEEGELVHTSGKFEIDWRTLPTEVEVHLRGSQYDAIVAQIAAGKEPELELSIDNRFFNGPVPQHNVIADIRGSEKPDEYVIVGGHLDSWDGAEGAVDNGTGVSTTLEAARLLVAAGAEPKRTIRFMLWSGEEQGLWGSKKYVEQHPEEMAKISAVLVHDGGTNYLSGLHVTPEMMAQMEQVFAPVQKLDAKYPFALETADSLRPGGSDHTPFINAGVPGFFWDQAGESDYDHMHHTQFDTFETAVPEYQQHSSLVVAIAAYNLANLDEMIDRTNSAPLPRRQIGARLDGMKVRSVEAKGAAAKAGWKPGDEIVAVEGEPVKNRWEAFGKLQGGDPRKAIRIRRGEQELDTTLDFTGGEGEDERARRQKERLERFGEPKKKPAEAEGEKK